MAGFGPPHDQGDCITVLEGFDALRLFLERTRRRRDPSADVIAFIIGGARFADGAPVDPAMWQDWTDSVQAARRGAQEGTASTKSPATKS